MRQFCQSLAAQLVESIRNWLGFSVHENRDLPSASGAWQMLETHGKVFVMRFLMRRTEKGVQYLFGMVNISLKTKKKNDP
jgi:hypothetical protein